MAESELGGVYIDINLDIRNTRFDIYMVVLIVVVVQKCSSRP